MYLSNLELLLTIITGQMTWVLILRWQSISRKFSSRLIWINSWRYNGCRDTTSFDITQNDSISISINNIDVSCFGGSDGILTSTATGGIGNIEFEWKNENGDIISIQPSVEDLSSQNYSQCYDNEGCESSVNVLLEQPEEIVILIQLLTLIVTDPIQVRLV